MNTPPPLRVVFRLRTPHGAPIIGAAVRVAGGGVRIAAEEVPGRPGFYRVELPQLGDYQVLARRLADAVGFDHRTLRATLFYIQAATEHAAPVLRVLRTPGETKTRLRRPRWTGRRFRIDGVLDYLWFTPIGTPPTFGNEVELLVDGEEGWAAVAEALEGARHQIHITTWMYQPTTELRRPDPFAPIEARTPHTIHDMLEDRADAGATVRLLVWDVPVLQLPEEARQAARDASTNFEVLEQENPAEVAVFNPDGLGILNKIFGTFKIGSYHQKTIVIDDTVGFAGGMNMKENDWDSHRHRLFEPRRARFGRSRNFRERVRDLLAEADHKPRHDFIARLEGPAVRHLAANFQERWNHVIADGGTQRGRWHATPVEGLPSPAATGQSQVQIVRTMPTPFEERGILDSHLRAIGKARRLIFIDDQYFRSTLVSDAIANAVRRWRELKLVVVTNQFYADDFIEGGWARDCYERIASRRPDFVLYAIKTFAVDARGKRHLEHVDNHSKLMIVDDRFMSVGSCNINDRGFEYEGELNVAVVDAPRIRAWRTRIWCDLLGGEATISGDIDADVRVWTTIAAHNARFEETGTGTPRGLIYPFVPKEGRPLINSRLVW